MIRNTVRIGERSTSVKLEPVFWVYLQQIAEQRQTSVRTLVRSVAKVKASRGSLASSLRLFCLAHARSQVNMLGQQLDASTIAGCSQDVLKALADGRLPISFDEDGSAFITKDSCL